MCRFKQSSLYEAGLPLPPAEAVANAFALIKPSANAFSIEMHLRSIFRQVPLRVIESREECFSLLHPDTSIDQIDDPIASSRKEISKIVRRQKIGDQKLDMAILQVSYAAHRTVAVEILSMAGDWAPHVRAHLRFSALSTLEKLQVERTAGNKRWLTSWTKTPTRQDGWTEVNLISRS